MWQQPKAEGVHVTSCHSRKVMYVAAAEGGGGACDELSQQERDVCGNSQTGSRVHVTSCHSRKGMYVTAAEGGGGCMWQSSKE